MNPDGEASFTATIRIDGINPYVDVPEPVAGSLGSGYKKRVLAKLERTSSPQAGSRSRAAHRRLKADEGRLRVIGRLAPGGWFRTTLLVQRSGATRLYLDKWMRATVGAAVADTIRVRLRRDEHPRDVPMPPALDEALRYNARARAAWERLAPSRQREILVYLSFLRTEAAFARNVQKTVSELATRRPDRSREKR